MTTTDRSITPTTPIDWLAKGINRTYLLEKYKQRGRVLASTLRDPAGVAAVNLALSCYADYLYALQPLARRQTENFSQDDALREVIDDPGVALAVLQAEESAVKRGMPGDI